MGAGLSPMEVVFGRAEEMLVVVPVVGVNKVFPSSAKEIKRMLASHPEITANIFPI